MTRLDSLHENRLFAMLDQLRTDLNAFRTPQQISGSSGIISYDVQTGNTWDYQATIGSDSDSSTVTSSWDVNFTGDGSQTPVLANLSFLVYVNGHQIDIYHPSWSDGSGRSATLTLSALDELRITYDQTITLVTLKAVTVQIKAQASSSSPGTVNVTKTL